MANLNKVFLIGRMTRDPETRSTRNGNTLVTFGIAVNRTYTRGGEGGEKVEETCFVDVEAWGRTGETIAKYLRKGRQLFLEGRLRFDSWEKDGQKRTKLLVVAENFQFLDSGQGGGGGQGHGGGERDEARAPVLVGARGVGCTGGVRRGTAGRRHSVLNLPRGRFKNHAPRAIPPQRRARGADRAA
jgi:single-strand DNA-binding protein